MKKRIPPKSGQESVWDYPRPPRLERTTKQLKVIYKGYTIAETNRAYRVLETSHPPVYYFPPEDINMNFLQKRAGQRTFCEFKGSAEYWNIMTDKGEVLSAAWSYPDPNARFLDIKGYLAFYASKVDACYVNDELVQTQEGDFYGGWITEDIVGPFKGGPGTWGW
jgi:uncharacterized protein (DUF427 family)